MRLAPTFLAVASVLGAARGIGVIAGLCVLSAQLVFWDLRAVGVKGCGGIAPVK